MQGVAMLVLVGFAVYGFVRLLTTMEENRQKRLADERYWNWMRGNTSLPKQAAKTDQQSPSAEP